MTPRPNKKLLYIMLFIIALVAIPGLYLGFLYVRDLRSDANTEVPPKNIQVFNRVDNSVEVAWTTELPASGKVKYSGSGSIQGESIDIRGDTHKGYSHLVRLRGLDPKGTYSFTVISEGKEYNTSSVTTFASVLTEPKSFAGTAKNSDQSTMSDTLIRATVIEKGSGQAAKTTTIGTVTANNGTWTLDAGNFRTEAGEKISSFTNYLIQVEALDKTGKVIARTISPDITSGQSVALYAGVLDDPVRVASAYTAATDREPQTTTTPSPTTTAAKPSVTPTIAPITTQSATAQVTNAQIVNRLDGSFAVVWETDIPTNSYVTYTINGGNKTNAFDKRSNEKLARSLRTHFVEITDTTNPAGTKYEITLVNNGTSWKDKISYTKIAMNEAPGLESIKLSFDKNGNFIDQILIASVPGKSTTIAATPNMAGIGSMDLSALRSSTNPSTKYTIATGEKLQFTLLGGALTNKSELEGKSTTELKATAGVSVKTTPKDTTPFKIIYINISDGEVIKQANPDFYGEGFKPSSELKIEIEKQQ